MLCVDCSWKVLGDGTGQVDMEEKMEGIFPCHSGSVCWEAGGTNCGRLAGRQELLDRRCDA